MGLPSVWDGGDEQAAFFELQFYQVETGSSGEKIFFLSRPLRVGRKLNSYYIGISLQRVFQKKDYTLVRRRPLKRRCLVGLDGPGRIVEPRLVIL